MSFVEIEGVVGTEPSVVVTEKSNFTGLNVAENIFKYDKEASEWEKVKTNWFNVYCFDEIGKKAKNLKVGDRILLRGSISLIDKSENGTRTTNTIIKVNSIRKLQQISNTSEFDHIPSFDSGIEPEFNSNQDV